MLQTAGEFKLAITALKPGVIPSEETIVTAARRLIESSSAWEQGKTYHKIVKTYHRPKGTGDGAPWHCRISEHPSGEVTFDQLWSKLGQDKPINEKEFIPNIKDVRKVKDVSPAASIWSLYYTFAPPISPRVFTALQIIHLDESTPRKGMIVSLPMDLSDPNDKELAALEHSGVRGRYVSVETLTELDNGSTEWRMATSSTPGGSIPSFLVESGMDSKIAHDVPQLLKWIRSLPN